MPSQPQRIISGLKETFVKKSLAERTNKAEIWPREQSEKAESCRENFRMKYSWKRYKDRNRHKNRKKEWKSSVFIKNRNRNVPTTWRWARGVHRTKHLENLRMENSERVPCIKHPLLKKNRLRFCRELWFWWGRQLRQNTGNQLQSAILWTNHLTWLDWPDLT